MIKIDDINDQRISLYKNLRYTPIEHIEQKIFIAEGEKVVKRVLSGNLKVHSLLANEVFYQKNSKLIESKLIDSDLIYYADLDLLNQIVGFKLHSGVMLIAYLPEDSELLNLDDKIIALNGVIDPENVGAIIRNCAAFDFTSVLVCEKSSSPYLRRAVRVGMGNIIDMKCHQTTNFKEAIQNLKRSGWQIISAEINDSSISLQENLFEEKFVLIFGSEGNGIDKEILNISDHILHIPINNKVNSLNVAVSSAIFMNHIRNIVLH